MLSWPPYFFGRLNQASVDERGFQGGENSCDFLSLNVAREAAGSQ